MEEHRGKLGPIPDVSKELQRLLEQARNIVITPQQLWDQRVSWAYGNAKLSNPLITKEMVAAEAVKIYGPRPEG